jgi:hypothetical protein
MMRKLFAICGVLDCICWGVKEEERWLGELGGKEYGWKEITQNNKTNGHQSNMTRICRKKI